jgi:hypothetical protein
MQHGREHAAWTRACSKEMDMQHGLGEAAWTRSINIAVQHEHGRGHEHVLLHPHLAIISELSHYHKCSKVLRNSDSTEFLSHGHPPPVILSRVGDQLQGNAGYTPHDLLPWLPPYPRKVIQRYT